MTDLVHRLRSWSLTPHLAHDVQEAADRIETLEAALREIADPYGDGYVRCQEIAHRVLAPELPKTILDEPTSPPELDK